MEARICLGSRISPKIGHRGIFFITFFLQRRNPMEHPVQILGLGSQYFRRYDLSKLGLFQAPGFHLKEVIVGKHS